MATSKKKLLKKVGSLAELRQLARDNPAYCRLLHIAASNLGGPSAPDSLTEQSTRNAYQYLLDSAMETDEDGVVDEVNFVRDLV